ncbi:MAG TPA: SDR family NAD(P)-dependent oxidoreductase [Ktedonobacterales bacterium]
MSQRDVAARGALVVGASGGIGAEVARELARRGYHVSLVARRVAELHTLAAAITVHRDLENMRVYPHDVRDTDSAPALFSQITADLEAVGAPLRVLVYTAGVMPAAGPGGWSYDDERAMIEVNLLGAIQWCDLAAIYFTTRRAGAIVGVSSVAGDRGRNGNSVYMASKAGLNVYLESLRFRLAGAGVRVVTVKPGFVDTPMTADAPTPPALTANPRAVARRIVDAATRGFDVVYSPWYWRPVMLVIKLIPGFLMKRRAF